MEINKVNNQNDRKCYNCGKVFPTIQAIERHKNRKTPCLIREVDPKDINNPNRCIFCNKIFKQKQHLTRHLKICKIKNGGMEMLADKVKYDQEIRILKELREKDKKENDEQIKKIKEEKDEQIKQLTERLIALEKSAIQQPAQVVNNTVNITNNITINNYLKPNLTYLFGDGNLFKTTFKEQLVQTPMAMIPLIWFNPEHPENFSIYLVNKSTKETLTYDGAAWLVSTADKVTKEVRDRAYEITDKIISNPSLKLIDNYTQYIPAQIKTNSTDEELIKLECEKIYNEIYQNRGLVKPYAETKQIKN